MPTDSSGRSSTKTTRGLPARFIETDDKASFVENFPRNIAPTTDDRPYFFNYTKWSDPFATAKFEVTSVSQGNPRFLLAQLGLSAVLAVTLIVLPLVSSRRVSRTHAPRFFVYFTGLGAGFIAIEIALIQKLTLFLGHPIYSITVTLFCILFFSGLGSLFSARWFERDPRSAWLIPLGLSVSLGLLLLLFPSVLQACIAWPLSARAAITAVALAPTAFLLGVPFAYGIRLLDRMNPALIPWAWAVNGAFSVVGSVLTVVVSMNFGFTAVLVGALCAYAIAFSALPRNVRYRG